MHDEEKSPTAIGFAAVTLVAIAVAGSALKAIQAWLHQLDKPFQIFAATAASGMVVAGYVLATVSILAATVAVIYVTYRYIQLVKQATEIQIGTSRSLREFKVKFEAVFETRLEEIESAFNFRFQALKEHVEAKIKPLEPKPTVEPKPKTAEASPQAEELEEQEDMNEEMSDSEPPLSQPF